MRTQTLLALLALTSLVACKSRTEDDTGTQLDDLDGDSWTVAEGDCDDADESVHPEADEYCDGKDNDCDGKVDEEAVDGSVWYKDADTDGWGVEDDTVTACVDLPGYCQQPGDCDDANPQSNPDMDERCNGFDDDCDGDIDEDDAVDAVEWYLDADGDGFGDPGISVTSCAPPTGYVADGTDCDDTDLGVNPDASEYCNGVDDNCNTLVDDGAVDAPYWYKDADGDKHGSSASGEVRACTQPTGYVGSDDDCDDAERLAHPDMDEVCDEIDNDCDGTVDEADATDALTWYADDDGDGFGDASSTEPACDQPAGFVTDDTDCDDTDDEVNPSEDEYCDGIDNNCDGEVDEDSALDAETWYADDDGDGYGDASDDDLACDQPSGFVSDDSDCDDTDEDVNPAATEVCDEIDNDCDGTADGADALDVSTWYADDDEDGYGDASSSTDACDQPSGYVSSDEDCDDTDDAVYPGAEEVCNGVDDDCNGIDDDDATDATELAVDADRDGFGAEGTTDYRCFGAENELDCDDSDATEPQFVDGLSGTSSPAGTFADPWLTIQDGIDAASTCVVVAPATYYENLDFDGVAVTVLGAQGAANTIIDGGASGPVVSFDDGEAADSVLTGFTLTNGSGYESVTTTSYSCGSGSTCTDTYTSYCGGGVYIDGSEPTLSDLIIQDNDLTTTVDYVVGDDNYYHFSYGGGICVLGSTVEIEQVDLRYNFAEDGGGLYADSTSDVSLKQGYVVGNTAVSGGGFQVDGGDLTLTNVSATFNEASTTGGGVYAIDASVAITNCTLGEDDSPIGGGLYLSGTSAGIVRNSIISGANTGEGVLVDSTASFTGTYNDVYGNAGGEYSGTADPTGANGNLSSDPDFVSVSDDGDLTNDDFHLDTGSPCIDAGNPSSSMDDADGTDNDMGAWGGPSSDW